MSTPVIGASADVLCPHPENWTAVQASRGDVLTPCPACELAFAPMKWCARCSTSKPDGEFHRWHRQDGLQPWCKACRKAYDAAYHQRVKERRRAQKRRNKEAFLLWYRALKASLPCADCGRCHHHAAMQFDHLPSAEKRGDVGSLMRYGSKQLILDEIAKGEPVCANCHAIRTFERRTAAAEAGAVRESG